jgi:anti-anti-sigma factor
MLRERLDVAIRRGDDLIVDLSGVRFMDASTIGVIVSACALIRERSGSLTIQSPSPFARRLLDVCHVPFGDRAQR